MAEAGDVVGVCLLDGCEEPIRKPKAGPCAAFCSDRHRVRWHQAQARQAKRQARAGRHCEVCGDPIDPAKPDGTVLCSRPCARKREYAAIKADAERLERHRERSRMAQFERYHGRTVVDAVRDSLRRRWESGAERVRAAGLGGRIEEFDVLAVFERDGWLCRVCGGRVPPRITYDGPLSPSIDHIVPVSAGGDHTYENTALTHQSCNGAVKRERPLERAQAIAKRRDGSTTVAGLYELVAYAADEDPHGIVLDEGPAEPAAG